VKRLLILILSLLPLLAIGQTELHSRKKKAIEDYQQARSLIILGQNAEATQYLISAIDRDKSFDEAILLLMQVYLGRNQKTQALNLYSNGFDKLEPQFQSKLSYDLAKYLWSSGSYEQAKQYLDLIEAPIYNVVPQDVALLSASIDYALAAEASDQEMVFEDLAPKMNRFDLQYFPSLDAAGQLVFTARDKSWGGDEQIMITRDSAEGWATPKIISENINSSRNEGTAAISADGKTLVFTGCNRKNNIGGCDLYIAYHEGDDWGEPSLLPETINTRFWESQPSLSSNGQTLYFVSTQPGRGGQDIWVSKKRNGRWTTADPLNDINTTKDDTSPFIYPDDVTLFFATNGRPGFGRFDLFRSVKTANGWLTPENLGKPINNEQDQMGYSISIDGWAYFSSTLPSGKIVMKRFRFPEDLLPELTLFEQQVYLRDAATADLIDGQVNIQWKDEQRAMARAAKGVYREVIQSQPELLELSANGYYKKEIVGPSDSLWVDLEPYPMNEVIGAPIFFGTNQWQVKNKYLPDLDSLVQLLEAYPNWKVSIEGYADAVGEAEDNLRLSEKRVDAVVQLLLKKGVNSDQLARLYFGESLASQDTQVADEDSDRKVVFRLSGIL